jgi:hypothetical protein
VDTPPPALPLKPSAERGRGVATTALAAAVVCARGVGVARATVAEDSGFSVGAGAAPRTAGFSAGSAVPAAVEGPPVAAAPGRGGGVGGGGASPDDGGRAPAVEVGGRVDVGVRVTVGVSVAVRVAVADGGAPVAVDVGGTGVAEGGGAVAVGAGGVGVASGGVGVGVAATRRKAAALRPAIPAALRSQCVGVRTGACLSWSESEAGPWPPCKWSPGRARAKSGIHL